MDLDRNSLFKVYDAAIAEYRFNVQINWDRTRFFLLLNSGLIAAGVGLMSIAFSSAPTAFFLALFFVLSILVALFGLRIVEVGKSHYQEAVYTKTLVERELGLLEPLEDVEGLSEGYQNLSIAVTRGQRNTEKILYGWTDGEFSKPHIAPGSIVSMTRLTFWTMIIIEAFGVILSFYVALESLS